jgi:hypothetical protein
VVGLGYEMNQISFVNTLPIILLCKNPATTPEFIQFMSSAGADLNKKVLGFTPLEMYCENGEVRLEIIKSMVENGAKLGGVELILLCQNTCARLDSIKYLIHDKKSMIRYKDKTVLEILRDTIELHKTYKRAGIKTDEERLKELEEYLVKLENLTELGKNLLKQHLLQ